MLRNGPPRKAGPTFQGEDARFGKRPLQRHGEEVRLPFRWQGERKAGACRCLPARCGRYREAERAASHSGGMEKAGPTFQGEDARFGKRPLQRHGEEVGFPFVGRASERPGLVAACPQDAGATGRRNGSPPPLGGSSRRGLRFKAKTPAAAGGRYKGTGKRRASLSLAGGAKGGP